MNDNTAQSRTTAVERALEQQHSRRFICEYSTGEDLKVCVLIRSQTIEINSETEKRTHSYFSRDFKSILYPCTALCYSPRLTSRRTCLFPHSPGRVPARVQGHPCGDSRYFTGPTELSCAQHGRHF